MEIWTYLVVTANDTGGWVSTGDSSLSFTTEPVAAVLNAAGEKGWELISAPAQAQPGIQYVFKRPVDIGEDGPPA
jgi:hypothetical protein